MKFKAALARGLAVYPQVSCGMYTYVYNRYMPTMFTKVPKTLGVSAFRAELAKNLSNADKGPVIIAERKGGKSYVLLSTKAYNKLVEAWEDEIDSRELERLMKRKNKRFVPLNAIKP